MLRVTYLSLTPTATATDPTPANSPIIHRRLAHNRLAPKKLKNAKKKSLKQRRKKNLACRSKLYIFDHKFFLPPAVEALQ